MQFRSRIALGVFVCASVLLGWPAVPALGQPPLIVNDPTRPSPIEIIDSSTYQLATVSQAWADFGDVMCIDFINHGTHSATGVGLNYAFVDATGTVVSVGSNFPTGTFDSGVLSSTSNAAERDIANGNCRIVSLLPEPEIGSTMHVIQAKTGAVIAIAAVFISAREVRYADGTVWRGASLPQIGETFALPHAPPFAAAVLNGPPRLVAGNVDAAPVEITDVFEMQRLIHPEGGNEAMVRVISAMPRAFTGGGDCFTFANRDTRAIRHVRIDAVVLDRRGYIVGLEPFDARGPFVQRVDPGAISGLGCTAIGGESNGETFMYENDAIEPIAAGQFIFTPIHVDFVDGSHWDNPMMPIVGHMVAAPKAAP